MKIIIIGAGELGHLVAAKLCSLNHDVVIVDYQHSSLEHAGETLDTKLLVGSGTSIEILKHAGAQNADLILALSGDEATNVLSCILAKKLGTKRAICRVVSKQIFSPADGIDLDTFYIDAAFSPIEESSSLIHSILQKQILIHKLTFQNPEARVDIVNIPLNSMVTGKQIRDIPAQDLLRTIRIAAIIRKHELVVPHGDTVLMPGDRLYIAGRKENVEAFTQWLEHDASVPIRRVVIAGTSPIAEKLITQLTTEGFQLNIIESDYAKAEKILENSSKNLTIIQGESTNMDILAEADAAGCDAFAALSDRDENNILACLLASRLGAKKVIALTRTAEYMDILPSIEQAGCWFNTTQIAANTAFRLMSGGTILVDPALHAINAKLVELQLTRRSKYAGKAIADCYIPKNFLIAMILRGEEVISPNGQTVLQENDMLIAIAHASDVNKIMKNL